MSPGDDLDPFNAGGFVSAKKVSDTYGSSVAVAVSRKNYANYLHVHVIYTGL